MNVSIYKLGILGVSGLFQDEGELHGTYKIQRDLKEKYSPQVACYDVRTWDHNPKEFASLLKNDGITHVIIHAYSWGGGYGAPRLCDELVRQGIVIVCVMVCDGVYRPKWLPAWGIANLLGFRAIIKDSASIKYHEKVQRIVGLRQIASTPMGHPISWRGMKYSPTVVFGKNVDHLTIDECDQWRHLVFTEVQKAVREF